MKYVSLLGADCCVLDTVSARGGIGTSPKYHKIRKIPHWRSVELNLVPAGNHIGLELIKYTTISPQEGHIFHMVYLRPKVV